MNRNEAHVISYQTFATYAHPGKIGDKRENL